MKHLLIMVIKLYQLTLSPMLKALMGANGMCRFQPTCSHYFIGALNHHGLFKGTFLGIKRILRCHPWGQCGYDPVPEKISKQKP